MKQIHTGELKAEDLGEFSEEVAIALSMPQREDFTKVNGILRQLNSPVGDENVFILNLSCSARFHPYHPEGVDECVVFDDVMRGSRSDEYEAFHPTMYNYFDRILGLIQQNYPDLYDLITSEKKVVSRKNLSLKLSLLEQFQQDDNLFIGHVLSI